MDMQTPAMPSPASTILRWSACNLVGWLLAIPAVIAIAYCVESLFGFALHAASGVGMGLAVGVAQWAFLRSRFHRITGWACISALSFTATFALFDLAEATGSTVEYSVYTAVPLAGVGSCVWQRLRFGRSVGFGADWIVGGAFGWSLAAGAIALADSIARFAHVSGWTGALVYLAIVLLGCACYGSITGRMLHACLHNASDPVA